MASKLTAFAYLSRPDGRVNVVMGKRISRCTTTKGVLDHALKWAKLQNRPLAEIDIDGRTYEYVPQLGLLRLVGTYAPPVSSRR